MSKVAPSAHQPLVFHPLVVADARPDTDDALVVTFSVPPELAERYAFVPGQHVTLRAVVDGVDVRRSYSICSPVGGPLRVGVKRVAGGRFSTWAHRTLQPGVAVDVLPPTGRFRCEASTGAARHVVAVAAGSGITPILSIVASVLATEPASTVTLVDVNRTLADCMFLDELHDLKDRHLGRFALWHLFTREPTDAGLVEGRPDTGALERLVELGVLPVQADAWYLCGPIELAGAVRDVLVDRRVPPELVHTELFGTGDTQGPHDPPPVAADAAAVASLSATLQGRRSQVEVRAGETLLAAVARVRPEAPFSCRSGVCTTCRALVRRGSATMRVCYGLEPAEVAAGYVLTCQATPTTPVVDLDFDA